MAVLISNDDNYIGRNDFLQALQTLVLVERHKKSGIVLKKNEKKSVLLTFVF